MSPDVTDDITRDGLGKTHSGTPVAVGLLLVLLLAGAYKWWPNDTRAIRRQLDALADTLTVPPTDSADARLERLAQFKERFTEDVRVRIGGDEVVSREALMAAAERWTPPPGGMFVEFVDTTVTVGADGTAEVHLTAKVSRGEETNPTVDLQPATITLARRGGDWLITGVASAAAPSRR